MTRFESNASVKSGYYFNLTTMNLVPVEKDGGRLPNEKGSWIAVPTLAALALTPILGALFLMFLPMIGFVLSADAAGKKVASAFSGAASDLAVNVTPGWAPGAAHLAGKEGEKKEGETTASPVLENLEKEIEAKRK
jgi:hypothetical protein